MWQAQRAAVERYPAASADWRSDVRCETTGDPTDPEYREWTKKEIWDLITNRGLNADPRDVHVWVRSPDEVAGAWGSQGQGGGREAALQLQHAAQRAGMLAVRGLCAGSAAWRWRCR